MKKLAFACILWLGLTPGAGTAEPLAIGFVLKNTIFVYSDSSFSAAVQDTLNLYDYVIVLGVKADEKHLFDLNGWARVETTRGKSGWVRYDGLAIMQNFIYASTPQDSVFEGPSRQARFLGSYSGRHMHRILERMQNEAGLWLGLQRFQSKLGWLLVKRFDYEWEAAYYKLIQAFLREEDPFLNIRLSADAQQALAVAQRLETMITPSDTVFLNQHSTETYWDKAVGAGAMVANIKSRVYRKLKQFDDAIRELQKIVTAYDQQPLFIGRAGAEAALDLADLYRDDLQDSARALAQYHRVIVDYPDEPFAGFEWNDWADKTNADLQTVRGLYRRVQDEFSEFYMYDSIYRDGLSTTRARRRFDHFQEAGINQAEIGADSVAFKVGFEAQYPAILFLPAGRRVKILYSDEHLKLYNEPSRHAKIALADGQAGWVLKEHLNPIREAVFENDGDNRSAWHMAYANSANNPVFAGPEIRQPKIVQVLEHYTASGLRFFDVNKNQTLDLLLQPRIPRSTYGEGIVLAVEGQSQQVLQTYDTESLGISALPDLVIAAHKLICKTYVRHANSPTTGELRAYDLYSGELVWRAPQAFDELLNLTYHNGRIYSVTMDSLIQCFNSENGELQWTVNLGATATGYRQSIQMAAHARALVAMSSDKSVFALHPETGEQLWRSSADILITTPVLDEETVYLISGSPLALMALHLADGAVKWKQRLSSAISMIFCLVTSQRVIYPSHEGILALDKATGQPLWVNQSIAFGYGLIGAGNSIYLIGRLSGDETYREYLLALRQNDGKLLWHMPMNATGSPLIFQSGRLFVQGETGVLVIADSALSRSADPTLPTFQLSQNYPNPFNGQTLISFELRTGANVQLIVYNVMGQSVRQLTQGFHYPGWYTATWDGTNEAGEKVGSGIYLYRLNVGQEASTKRLLLLK